jgi:hypothetical protein
VGGGEEEGEDETEGGQKEREAFPTRSDKYATDKMTRDLHEHTTASTCFCCVWL